MRARRKMLRAAWTSVAIPVAFIVPLAGFGSAAGGATLGGPGRHSWPAYLGGAAHGSYNNQATAITTRNAAQLSAFWRWTPPARHHGAPTLWATPTIYRQTAYIGAEDGWFYAVDRNDHRVSWSRFIGFQPARQCRGTGAGGVVSTATVARDPVTDRLTLYVFGPNGSLYALAASSGAVVWRAKVDHSSVSEDTYYSWSSPTVANGKVYIGTASRCDNPLMVAGVNAYDQHTGSLVARWTSSPPGSVGASVWSSVGVAPDGSVFATTGNSQGGRSMQRPYADSVVKLDPITLGVEASWEVPRDQLALDSDFGGSPTFFSADVGGVPTAMVGACNKNGVYYAFRQSDLSLVWQARIGTGTGLCLAAASWDGTNLVEGGGSDTVLHGRAYQGSVESLDPATGSLRWERGVPGVVWGSPSEDGAGVVAATVFTSASHRQGVYFFDVANGRRLDRILTPNAPLFGQAVFVGADVVFGGPPPVGLADYRVTP